MLEVRDVAKSIAGRTIFDRVELCCSPSEVVVLTGANGSGKTTLLRVIAGMIEPSRGAVDICGHSLATDAVRAKRHLGYVPDGLEVLPELLVSELIALVAALKATPQRPRPEADPVWKQRLGVHQTWSQRASSLSFGQKKRVVLLAALIGSPELLILDEPSNGLDPSGVDLIRQLIEERRRAGAMTVLSTNDAAFESSISATRYRLTGGTLEPLPAAARQR